MAGNPGKRGPRGQWPVLVAFFVAFGLFVLLPSAGCELSQVPAPTEASRTHAIEVAPPATTGPRRVIVLFPEASRPELEEALRTVGGRVLATFNEPAAILQLTPAQDVALQGALPGVVVAVGAVEEPSLLEIAPTTLAYWNRRQGVSVPATPESDANREPPPTGRRYRAEPLGEAVEMPETLEIAAQRTLRRLVECLAQADPQASCLEVLLTAEALESQRELLEREAQAAQRHQIDASDFTFLRRGFDGTRAVYEMQREAHPTATIHLTRRGDTTWIVTLIDP